jgi:hypothetical protein
MLTSSPFPLKGLRTPVRLCPEKTTASGPLPRPGKILFFFTEKEESGDNTSQPMESTVGLTNHFAGVIFQSILVITVGRSLRIFRTREKAE